MPLHDEQMWDNPKFARLDVWARLLMNALIDTADDQGRMPGDPAFVRSRCFPYDDIAVDMMQKLLNALEGNGFLILYEVDGQWYLQLCNWWKWQDPQWAAPSQHPAPPDWEDRIHWKIPRKEMNR